MDKQYYQVKLEKKHTNELISNYWQIMKNRIIFSMKSTRITLQLLCHQNETCQTVDCKKNSQIFQLLFLLNVIFKYMFSSIINIYIQFNYELITCLLCFNQAFWDVIGEQKEEQLKQKASDQTDDIAAEVSMTS